MNRGAALVSGPTRPDGTFTLNIPRTNLEVATCPTAHDSFQFFSSLS